MADDSVDDDIQFNDEDEEEISAQEVIAFRLLAKKHTKRFIESANNKKGV